MYTTRRKTTTNVVKSRREVKPRREVETASGTASGTANKTAMRIEKLREIRVLPLYIESLINNDDKYNQVIQMYEGLMLYVSDSEVDFEIYAREPIIRRIIAEQIDEFLKSGGGDIKSYNDKALELIQQEQGIRSKPKPAGWFGFGRRNTNKKRRSHKTHKKRHRSVRRSVRR